MPMLLESCNYVAYQVARALLWSDAAVQHRQHLPNESAVQIYPLLDQRTTPIDSWFFPFGRRSRLLRIIRGNANLFESLVVNPM